eukprot:763303-Hanusia_phi.AAC.13
MPQGEHGSRPFSLKVPGLQIAVQFPACNVRGTEFEAEEADESGGREKERPANEREQEAG